MNKKYFEEIMQQPDVLHKVTDEYPVNDPFLTSVNSKISSGQIDNVILTGMGASLASCYPLWLKFSKKGISATLWETSELVYYGCNLFSPKTLVIAVSQSGESIEIKNLIQHKKEIGFLIAITNDTESTLGKNADICINLYAGEEQTVSTKTYTASLAALHLLGTQILLSNVDQQKEAIHSLAETLKESMIPLRENVDKMASFFGKTDQLVVLGRGFSIASVQISSLILKEASKIFTFGLSSGQFRHGPMEIVRPGLNAILFIGCSSTQGINENLASDLNAKSCKVSVITQHTMKNASKDTFCLQIPPAEDDLLPILEIVPIQFLTIPLAEFLGFTAGDFINCEKVTLIE